MLTWVEWLLFTDDALRRHGADPAERYARTGHRRCLRGKHWARTIGMWRHSSMTEIRDVACVTAETAAMFRTYWKLEAGDLRPLQIPVLATSIAALVEKWLDGGCTEADAVVAAAQVVGVLPIEAHLHRGDVLRMLEATGLPSALELLAAFPADPAERYAEWIGLGGYAFPRQLPKDL